MFRATDPDTSRLAAESMVDEAATQREIIYNWLLTRGGMTADKLDQELGLRVTSAGRRLSELEAVGRVAKTERREMTRSGRWAIVWEAIRRDV
jgi:predicted ArsR family transcriptional regulator